MHKKWIKEIVHNASLKSVARMINETPTEPHLREEIAAIYTLTRSSSEIARCSEKIRKYEECDNPYQSPTEFYEGIFTHIDDLVRFRISELEFSGASIARIKAREIAKSLIEETLNLDRGDL